MVDAGASPANDKASKKREEKERKEREKLEKKKKEEAERKFKKEEEERKRKEREERKRTEKERKSFNVSYNFLLSRNYFYFFIKVQRSLIKDLIFVFEMIFDRSLIFKDFVSISFRT